MNVRFLALILALASVFHGTEASAVTTYYVSNTGNNANAGTTTVAPWRTITYGVGRLVAGDTLLVRGLPTVPGIYDEGLSSMPSGTSWTNKIRIAAYPGETVWMTPLVHGVGNPGNVLRFNAGNEHYIEFDGINMDGSGVGYGTVAFVVNPDGEPHHIRIQNAHIIARRTDQSSVSSDASMGIEVFGGRSVVQGGFEFRYLTITGGGRPNVYNDYRDNGYGIYLATSNSIVEYCDISDGKGAGVHIFNDDGALPDNNIVRNNRIHDQTRNTNIGQLWGVIVFNGSNNQIYNNVIYRVKAGAGTLPGGQGIVVSSGTGNKIWNNTVYDNTAEGIILGSGAVSTQVHNNILYGNGTNYSPGTSTGTSLVTNLVGTNPVFVSAGSDDYHLSSTSPAIDVGTGVSAVATDIAGTVRPQGIKPDIGAYEFIAAVVPEPPTNVHIVP